MTQTLAEKTCTPCRGGIPPLTSDEAQRYQAHAPDWQLRDESRRIERTVRFVEGKCSSGPPVRASGSTRRARVNRQPGASEGRPTSARRRPRGGPGEPLLLSARQIEVAYQRAPEPCWKHGPGTCHPHWEDTGRMTGFIVFVLMSAAIWAALGCLTLHWLWG